ncbi:hypothetical protein [Nocardia sp. CNY236]|uniref:hypothetical protein n=1 Tax=Nocardia sp. CNY236 TaxID=1169152 RepID=UPI0004009398|nr:hypothetical protein [Nocardia sp. CNY236]
MRRRGIAVLLELVLAVLALLGAIASWRNSVRTTDFAPSGDVPGFTAVRYAPPWQILAAVLVAVAGVLAIDAVARIARRIRGPIDSVR